MIKSSGPQPCEILLVGEAPGKTEDALGLPFLGAAGQELRSQLEIAGFSPGTKYPFFPDSEVRLTNVFLERPVDNKVEWFCGKRGDVSKTYTLPPLGQGKWVLERHLHYLDILRQEILATNPRLIIALGNTAAWALLHRTGITSLRGSVFPSNELVPGIPVLPTFHPSAVLREWSNRVIALGDLMKARRYLDHGPQQKVRQLLIEPTLDEVRHFCSAFILDANPRPSILSFDVETFGETITCIGFAPDSCRAICIPFLDPAKPDRNYWSTLQDELAVWCICRDVLCSDIPKLGQNGLYDLQYLLRAGIPVQAYLHDTMIRHHSRHPELDKGLGFLATLYTDEQPWKLLRNRNRDNFKLDDE